MIGHAPSSGTVYDEMMAMVQRFGSTEEVTDEERLARTDFGEFMRRMNPEYIEGDHLDVLRDSLVAVEQGRIKRLIITMPPRHSKSMHVSEGFPAWYLGRHPTHRVIAASHTQSLADRFSRSVRAKIRNPRWPFHEVRLSRESSGVRNWQLEGYGAGGYTCVGVGGSPTGIGGNLIIIDDPIRNQADADSLVIRDAIWEWFTGTIYTRRQPDAAIIVTATRWHEDDLTGRLLKAESEGGEHWEHIHMPAKFDDGSYLWEEFFPAVEYKLAEKASPRVWNAQYMGRPFDEAGNLMRREWFPYAPVGERYQMIVLAWDTAEKPGLTNDFSVCAVIGIGPVSYDIIDIWEEKVGFPELLQAAKDRWTWAQTAFYGLPMHMVIEDKSSGVQLIQMLNKETRIPVQAYTPPSGKDPKIQRVIGMTPLARSGRIRIREGSEWINRLLGQFSAFPTGTNDDIVDACMIGLVYATGIGGGDIFRVVDYNEPEDADDIPSPRAVRAVPPKRRINPNGVF